VFSCYWTPNGPSAAAIRESFDHFLGGLEDEIRQGERPNETLIVAGDFNAKSSCWGSSDDDHKGEALESMVASLGLWTNNVGSRPTFRRGASSSIIDVTFSGPGPYVVRDWRVLDDYSASDHMYLSFVLSETREHRPEPEPQTEFMGWSLRKLDLAALDTKLREMSQIPITYDTAEESANKLGELLTNICDASMPRRFHGGSRHKPVHWWNDEIADQRLACIRSRRAYLRMTKRRGPAGSLREREAFREARKALRVAIRKSQERSWKELCQAVDNDPWGIPYRIVTKRLSRQPPGIAARGREIEIADALFPTRPSISWEEVPMDTNDLHHETRDMETGDTSISSYSLTLVELDRAATRLPRGKACGPDGVPNEVLTIIVKKAPSLLFGTLSRCISEAVFPKRWKRARLVLLHKGQEKPITNPSSFRPLCMLDTAGKLLERIVLQRLNDHLDRTGGLSPNQFGFRKGKSTEDAINEVLDLANWAGKAAT